MTDELQDLKSLLGDVDATLAGINPKPSEISKPSGSTALMQMTFQKVAAEKSEQVEAKEIKSPSEINANLQIILNKPAGAEDRLASRLARKNALKEKLRKNDSHISSNILSNADKAVEEEAQNSNRLSR